MEPNGMMVVDALFRKHGIILPGEVWVHGMWTPEKWIRCVGAKLRGKTLVRMTHGSLSPIYLERQGKWKKRLVKPIEKLLFKVADKIVFTGEWEAEWFEKWMPGQTRKFEIVDLKRFFNLSRVERGERVEGPLRVLYLGRRHPLKGVEYLEEAIKELNSALQLETSTSTRFALRIVSDHTGEELERDWAWADVLCLPTLSDNFGLVVAEALERGKRVITTDGAPAWRGQPGVVYLKGYREGDDEQRVNLLVEALRTLSH